MGELLNDVRHIEGKGLVGFTESGKEVLLDEPKPDAVFFSKEFFQMHKDDDARENYVRNIVIGRDLVKNTGEEVYIQRGEVETNSQGVVGVGYVLFEKRK